MFAFSTLLSETEADPWLVRPQAKPLASSLFVPVARNLKNNFMLGCYSFVLSNKWAKSFLIYFHLFVEPINFFAMHFKIWQYKKIKKLTEFSPSGAYGPAGEQGIKQVVLKQALQKGKTQSKLTWGLNLSLVTSITECCCSVAKSCPTLWFHGLQHARLPCPPLSPGVCSNSCPLSWWCYPTISSSASPFSFCL